MFRRLRVLAAFFMVPVVLFVNPQTASAATAGPWSTITVEVPAAPLIGDSAPGSLDTIDCTFSLRQMDGQLQDGIEQSTGQCFGLPDVTPGFTQPGEAGETYGLTASGQLEGGGTCQFSRTAVLGPHSKNGTLRVAGTMPPGMLTGTYGTDCNITQVCVTFNETECANIDVPALATEEPEEPVSSCPAGQGHFQWVIKREDWGNDYKYRLFYKFSVAGGPAVSTAAWYAHINTNAGFGGGQLGVVALVPGETDLQRDMLKPKGDPAPNPWAFTGVEVYATGPAPAYWYQTWNNGYQGTDPTIFPVPKNHGYFGWTDPDHCMFYFGPKRLNWTGGEGDEPYGTGADPYVPPPDPVVDPEPELEDPEDDPDDTLIDFSWLWGILDAIRRAVLSVVNAIKGIASAIVDGISGLFMPDPQYGETKWAAVEAKWDGSTPGKYVDAIDSFDTGGVSGCAGLPLQITLPGGVQISEHIGNSCGGGMAVVASITRIVITAVVTIGGAFACIRAVGSGLGWNPAVGRGDGS